MIPFGLMLCRFQSDGPSTGKPPSASVRICSHDKVDVPEHPPRLRHLCVTPKGFFERCDETTERGQTPQSVDHRLTAAFEQPIVSCAEGFRRELHPLAFPHCRRADRSRADTHHASDRGAQIDTNDGAGSGENRRWYNDRGDIPDRCEPEHCAAFGVGVFADGRGRPLDERCGGRFDEFGRALQAMRDRLGIFAQCRLLISRKS